MKTSPSTASRVSWLPLILVLASPSTWAQLGVEGNQFWCSPTCNTTNLFGSAMTSGDFDGDGREDLVIGAPWESNVNNNHFHHGAAQLLLGSDLGLSGFFSFQGNVVISNTLWEGIDNRFGQVPNANEEFAAALATGDFNSDGRDDLVIGIPGDLSQVVGSADFANPTGAVIVMTQGDNGISVATGNRLFVGDRHPSEFTGDVEIGQRYGQTLAVGDFDNNGADDLVIGVPGETIAVGLKPGAVRVHYSHAGGLIPTPELWHLNVTAVDGVAVNNDAYASALATGDFNCDQYDDMAVGVPGYSVGGDNSAGLVSVIFGSDSGLAVSPILDQAISQDSAGIQGGAEVGDQFGAALAAGDFDNDGCDDLAVGIPGEDVAGNTVANGGAVAVIYGSAGGLSERNDFWRQGLSGVMGSPNTNDAFGTSVAVGDFNNDGYADLAVGVPGELVSGVDDIGVVNVLRGSSTGLKGDHGQLWHWDVPGVVGSTMVEPPSPSGHLRNFGNNLAIGDWDGNGFDDLAIQSLWTQTEFFIQGIINALYGDLRPIFADGFEDD